MPKPRRSADEGLVQFLQDVPKERFRLLGLHVDGREKKFLVFPRPIGVSFHARQYHPLRMNPLGEEKIFLDFSKLPKTEEAILNFANRCGALGVGEEVHVPERLEAFEGEPIRRWREEIHAMRHAVDVWLVLQGGDRAFLKAHIRIVEGEPPLLGCYERHLDDGSSLRRTILERRDFPAGVPKDRLLAAGTFVLQDMIRPKLREHVGASILLAADLATGPPKRVPLVLRLVPKNLLGALWLQFAREVDAGTEYRKCLVCAKRFPISAEGFRRNKKLCSDRCRQKDFRARHRTGRPRGRPRKISPTMPPPRRSPQRKRRR